MSLFSLPNILMLLLIFSAFFIFENLIIELINFEYFIYKFTGLDFFLLFSLFFSSQKIEFLFWPHVLFWIVSFPIANYIFLRAWMYIVFVVKLINFYSSNLNCLFYDLVIFALLRKNRHFFPLQKCHCAFHSDLLFRFWFLLLLNEWNCIIVFHWAKK